MNFQHLKLHHYPASRKLTRPKNATRWSAWKQLQTYKAEIAPLFASNALLVRLAISRRLTFHSAAPPKPGHVLVNQPSSG